METTNMTPLEITFLLATQKTEFTSGGSDGTDRPWVFAAIDASGIPAAQARGVMASLVKKGVLSIEDSEGKGRANDQYVLLSDEGKALYHTLAAVSPEDTQIPQTEMKPVAVFACGNVLDPHIRIEGDCRACLGTGWADGDLDPSRKCEICFGTGKATALVRFTELIRTVGPALEYVKVTEEPI